MSLAKPASGCEPVRSSSRAPLPPTRRALLPPIPRRSASRPAIVPDAADLAFESLPTGLFPAAIPANHNVGDTNNSARHRRRLRHSCISGSRPNLAPIARCLSQHQMPIQRFHHDRRRIPPPRVQPIGQSAHGVPTVPAHVPPHPNHHPSRTQAAHLPAITTMPLHPHQRAIARQLPALRTESRPKLFHRWRACARAQRCSTEMARLCKLTTVDGGGGLRLVSLLKKNWPQPPPFL